MGMGIPEYEAKRHEGAVKDGFLPRPKSICPPSLKHLARSICEDFRANESTALPILAPRNVPPNDVYNACGA
jgi:hypothetical protein